MARCKRGVFIALLLGFSLVHYSQNKCEPFGDDFPLSPLTLDKFEVTFETENLKKSVTCGEYVPLQEFKDSFKRTAPMVKYSDAESDGKYLIMMVDPDAPSRGNPTCQSWLHWILGNIEGDDLKEGSIGSGSTFTDYNPPTPPKGSGPHRYYLFVFKQQEDLGSEAEVDKRCGFSIDKYKGKFHLTAVAANMFTTENE